MSNYIPGLEPSKKKELLVKRQLELEHALRHNFSPEKLKKVIEKYRSAQISLLKAIIHKTKDKELQKLPHNTEIKNLEDKIMLWENKTEDEIILEFKKAISSPQDITLRERYY